jgi:Acetyltransferases, including N-acetylases of ribosomal proteins
MQHLNFYYETDYPGDARDARKEWRVQRILLTYFVEDNKVIRQNTAMFMLRRERMQIETPRLILRELGPRDVEAIFAYASDPEVTHYTTWEPHQALSDTVSYLQQVEKNKQETDLGPLGMCLKSNPAVVIGSIALIDRQAGAGELQYVLARPYWRQGLVFEAAQTVIGYAQEKDLFQKLVARCVKDNKASSAILHKLGMACISSSHRFAKGQEQEIEQYELTF